MSELKLTDRTWGKFSIGDLFQIENCKCSKVSVLKEGNVPYIGATNRNNGVLSFVENKSSFITKGNCIVFICDGEGSIGYSIYKKEDFIGTTTIKVGRNEYLNKY
ncbi:restriction endonuclease subunit S, partial [Glaesserella parasuis]|nr:restriction endonuclease subunit S [Glaesserella parasuis]MCT8592895.1 restriction endonuclease subunit S [Glaesserella parasuis]